MKKLALIFLLGMLTGAFYILFNNIVELQQFDDSEKIVFSNDLAFDYNTPIVTEPTFFIYGPDSEEANFADEWIAMRRLDNGDIQLYTKDFETIPFKKSYVCKFLFGAKSNCLIITDKPDYAPIGKPL